MARQPDEKVAAKFSSEDSALIRELAHAYGNATNAQLCWTLGITEHHNAVDNVFALINLALLTGKVGKWGSGLQPLRGQNNVQGGGDMGAIPNKLSGFQDVENALIDRTKFGQVREEQAKNVQALRRFRDLADLRYREGATIYLEVANAEQSLFLAELAYVATQAQLFQSYANLYKAMGGGWVEEAERLSSREN